MTQAAPSVSAGCRRNLTAEGGRTFGYSSDNRLTSMTGGGRTYGFSYDAVGRLQEVTATGLAARSYAWDGNDAIVTYQGGNFLLRTVYGPGENEPLYQLDSQGRRTWFVQDERGSTIAGSDASGAAAGQQGYDDYGEGNSSAYAHGFTGALRLRTTGLYYMRARIYDPKLGRFLQPDPIGYGDGMNRCIYAGNDPVNRRDPSGLKDTTIFVNGQRLKRSDQTGRGAGGGLAGGVPGSPSERADVSPADQERTCANGVIRMRVSSLADGRTQVTISGAIEFRGAAADVAASGNFYLNAINRIWSGEFGRYSINTDLVRGTGGIIAHIWSSNTYRADAVLGGAVMTLPTLLGATGPGISIYGNAAGHEIGHNMGLVDRYRDHGYPLIQPGYAGSLMGSGFTGSLTERTVEEAIAACIDTQETATW